MVGHTIGGIWHAAGELLPEEHGGFWGHITSTLDWCEQNYAVTSYIAEFWNSTTNAVIFGLGLFGSWNAWRIGAPRRIVAAYLCLSVVGFGSALFHGTLLYHYQLLDEIPMSIGITAFAYCVTPPSWRAQPEQRALLGAVLLLSLVAITAAYVETRHVLLHEGSFFLFSCAVFKQCVDWAARNKKNEDTRLVRSILYWGAIMGWGAFALWNFENVFCKELRRLIKVLGPVFTPLLNFHGLWHIGTGIAGYALGLFTETLDQDYDPEAAEAYVREGKPRFAIKQTWWGFPYSVRVDHAQGKAVKRV